MPSQIELLKENLERLEPEHGPDNPFVKGLKQQIAGLENQQSRAQDREQFNLAVTSSLNPAVEPEEQAAAKLYEQRISELQNATASPATEQPASPESIIPSNLEPILQAVTTALDSQAQRPDVLPPAVIPDLAKEFTSTLTKEAESVQKLESDNQSTA